MELAIETACAKESSVYNELPEITDVWTWT
jgi:hypothetical protein